MWFAMGVFIFSLAGIASLFALKEWEKRTGRVTALHLRGKLDELALHLKEMLIVLQDYIEKLPFEMLQLLRIALHEAMLAAASSLRFLERKLHELADLVSHKHRFERRAPRSEFLTEVLDHKNGENAEKRVDRTP